MLMTVITRLKNWFSQSQTDSAASNTPLPPSVAHNPGKRKKKRNKKKSAPKPWIKKEYSATIADIIGPVSAEATIVPMGDDLLELNSGQYQLWKFDAANSKWAIQSFNNQVDQSPPPDPSGQINPVTRPQTDTTAAEHDLALAEQRFSDLQLGNWSALLNYTIEELEHHHVREKLALYAGAAHIQSGQLEQGRELVNQAITWGIDRKLVARTLISGIHHNLGNAETVGGNERRAIHHYRHAAVTIRPRSLSDFG